MNDITQATVGNLQQVKEFLAIGATALLIAAKNGHMEVVQVLLQHLEVMNVSIANGASVDKERTNGTTPLFHTANKGNLEVVQVLLETGADADKVHKMKGITPILSAKK
jgi:ankyrin repeat protein